MNTETNWPPAAEKKDLKPNYKGWHPIDIHTLLKW